jgi:hypothetical protein
MSFYAEQGRIVHERGICGGLWILDLEEISL